MTVYTDQRFLEAAVRSILLQDFDDFELIVVDDGSGASHAVEPLTQLDRRIRVLVLPWNVGTAEAANQGIAIARGRIIARLDSDDIAERDHLGRLVKALDDPSIGLVGTSVTLISESGEVVGRQSMPETDAEIRWIILFHNPFYHSTVAYRRDLFDKAGRYRVGQNVSQDHYLWFDLLPLARMRNLPDFSVRYRLNPKGLTATKGVNPRSRTHAIRESLWRQIGLSYDLYDDEPARQISAYLRGDDLDVQQRVPVLSKLTTVLTAFLRAARRGDIPVSRTAARTLAGNVIARVVRTLPMSQPGSVGILARCLAIAPGVTLRGVRDKFARKWTAEPAPGISKSAATEARPAATVQPVATARSENMDDWFAGKHFSTNWSSRHYGEWARVLGHRRGEQLRILEVGSWEGRSAILLLNLLHNSTITCIDTFGGGAEHREAEKWRDVLPHIEARFDANLLEYAPRVEKIRARSIEGLARLVAQGRRFDVAFIDGSHVSADVQADTILAWELLAPGGVMIFDDYDWNRQIDELQKPRMGIDSFLGLRPGEFVERHRDYQLIIEKL